MRVLPVDLKRHWEGALSMKVMGVQERRFFSGLKGIRKEGIFFSRGMLGRYSIFLVHVATVGRCLL